MKYNYINIKQTQKEAKLRFNIKHTYLHARTLMQFYYKIMNKLAKVKMKQLTPSLINFFACSVASAAASAAESTNITALNNINDNYKLINPVTET